MSNNNQSQIGADLIQWLLENADNTAIMSDLRRGAGLPYLECDMMHKWMTPFVREHKLTGWSRQVAYLVSTLFVLAGKKTNPEAGNFGNSCVNAEIADRRFEKLLQVEPVDLVGLLPNMVQAVTRHGQSIDFYKLYVDLVFFTGEYTRLNWAEAFWAYRKPPSSNSSRKQEEE